MSAVSGVNYTKHAAASPADALDAGAWGGKVRCQFDQYEASALEAASTINIACLPKGSRVLPQSYIAFDDLGSSVTLAVGDSGDPDRYLEATGANAAGVAFLDKLSGWAYEQTAETIVIITTAGAAATGTIYSAILYTVN